jgi:hypothetical protein
MVYDELKMLQKLQHPHIVSFVDWFESKVCDICQHAWSFAVSNHIPGQILHRDTTGHWWRAV